LIQINAFNVILSEGLEPRLQSGAI